MFDFLKDVFLEANGIDSKVASGGRGDGVTMWECRCDCGNIIPVRTEDLLSGKSLSCGCQQAVQNLTGKQFGKLTVVRPLNENFTSTVWQCKCLCGKTTFASTNALTAGNTTSCGCGSDEKSQPATVDYGVDLKGMRFGWLTVLEPLEQRKSKKKERFIFSTSMKVIAYILGILYLAVAVLGIVSLNESGGLKAYHIVRSLLLSGCDVAALVCLAIQRKKAEIAALILIIIFVVAQYATMVLV